MKFAKVAIPDLTAALHQRGFSYLRRDGLGWMRFAGELRLKAKHYPCELAVSPGLDEFPRVWLTPVPPGRPELLPHLSANGYLCYLALGSVIFDFFDPIRQTMACLDRAEQVLEDILADKMIEDLAEEFSLIWGRDWCLLDVDERRPGSLNAYTFGGKASIVTDDKARTQAKLEAIEIGLPRVKLSVFRVYTKARPMPLQESWPPKTVQAFLKWQNTLDPACRKKIEQRLMEMFRAKAARVLVLIDSPQVKYGIEVNLKRDTAGTNNKLSLREILYRLPLNRISVCRIDDQYLAERNLPGSKTLARLKVGLVGCGTIGGYLAEMLVKAGAGTVGGKLTLVDMGSLEPGNLGRHRLGFSALIKKKAAAMCDELRRVAPGVDAVAVVGDVKAANLGPLDLLIDATGEQGLTDWLTWKYADKVPFLSVWVEGSGLAVRALLKAKPEYACARCVSQPPLRERYRVFDVPPEVIMKGHGCEGLYVPFPAAASVQAAALAMEMVLAWLDGTDSPSFRTRVLDQSREANFKDCSPQRYEGCPACAM
ncbi:MAG: ThiF family adenylyltransferase [Methyloversatilis discipulorum]|uniref:ThiF family adenylyltransferase n=1 Tax=Methyloversatilis discipulorum TaxID=1119528 RepID=UPI0026ED836A|nr:ThiF family adenylyltransferase [Methyloversatilis discipulorum]MBV5284843.1 ThiF family adenylyltransferase [Methyloversatilis discipulorum]